MSEAFTPDEELGKTTLRFVAGDLEEQVIAASQARGMPLKDWVKEAIKAHLEGHDDSSVAPPERPGSSGMPCPACQNFIEFAIKDLLITKSVTCPSCGAELTITEGR